MGYVELQALTAFSFQEGASLPEEIANRAAQLNHTAIAIADRNSLSGIVKAHVAAKKLGLRFIVGTRLDLADGQSFLAYPKNRSAYGRLCRLITLGRRRADKGNCEIYPADLLEYAKDILLIALPDSNISPNFIQDLQDWRAALGNQVFLAASRQLGAEDTSRIRKLSDLAEVSHTPLVATNNVIMHTAERRKLADILACVRNNCTVDTLGRRALVNAERHLKSETEMLDLFRGYEAAVTRSVEIAELCDFNLDELRYEYPEEPVPSGVSTQNYLEQETWAGAHRRYPNGIPEKIRIDLERELELTSKLGYAQYFLTVYDIVRFARHAGIISQGRGSAANSAICYCLGITSVNPMEANLLFERFISIERGEPPDIDIDFEHERREEIIQYIYRRYGRERAGLAATVIHYRGRSAVRDVGKAMGLSSDIVSKLASQTWNWSLDSINREQIEEIGLDPNNKRLSLTLDLSKELIGFPRHLSQHVGGFVITKGRLDELVPVENASMEDRTVVEWDKDDLDALGILKIDILALGMLSVIKKSFDLIQKHYGRRFTLATIPREDPSVYDMLCRADSIGVFQVESRAQIAFLPRMRPRTFYDLVVEVAIVRPGPIQGDMVHPYIRRRNGEEPVDYPSPILQEVLGRTLGVPLFQEQAMKIAIVAGGFTPGQADELRRAMATFRHTGRIHSFRDQFYEGMRKGGYDDDFAKQCFSMIEGFGEYGFPESHAASFALLVYASAWIKKYYPDVFLCALLNSQPMGFYAPAQLVRDAREHEVEVRPVDVNYSSWDNILEPSLDKTFWAVRLGFRQVKGFKEEDAEWLVAARGNGYRSIEDIWRRAGLKTAVIERLAQADALQDLELSRRQALWETAALQRGKPLPLFATADEAEYGEEVKVSLCPPTLGEEVYEDYSWLRLSLRAHPLALLRDELMHSIKNKALTTTPNNKQVDVAGLVIARQRPGSAKGVIFATLEDETGVANVIIWPKVFEKYRRIVLTARLLKVTGKLQREGIVTHIIADKLEDISHLLEKLVCDEQSVSPITLPDEISHQSPPAKQVAIPRPRHPRDQARVLFPSRDFK
ncbi:MAG: error-prone DNA polymerase [Rhodospirillales bacterium]